MNHLQIIRGGVMSDQIRCDVDAIRELPVNGHASQVNPMLTALIVSWTQWTSRPQAHALALTSIADADLVGPSDTHALHSNTDSPAPDGRKR